MRLFTESVHKFVCLCVCVCVQEKTSLFCTFYSKVIYSTSNITECQHWITSCMHQAGSVTSTWMFYIMTSIVSRTLVGKSINLTANCEDDFCQYCISLILILTWNWKALDMLHMHTNDNNRCLWNGHKHCKFTLHKNNRKLICYAINQDGWRKEPVTHCKSKHPSSKYKSIPC